MALLPPLIGCLLPGCLYHHRQEKRSTPIPVVVNRPCNQGNHDPQLGHPSPVRPHIALIATDGALNPGLEDRFSPEIPKTHEPRVELRSAPVCFYSVDVVLRLRCGKGSGETVSEPSRDPSNAAPEWQAYSLERRRISAVACPLKGLVMWSKRNTQATESQHGLTLELFRQTALAHHRLFAPDLRQD